MLAIRRATDRGHAHRNWLDCRYSFTDEKNARSQPPNFRALRAINEIKLMPRAGFAAHRHTDTEILNYVLDGALEHTDSAGTANVITPGELQFIGAGRGIVHSERNHSKYNPLHYLEIYIEPGSRGLESTYQRQTLLREDTDGHWLPAASGQSNNGGLRIRQDIEINMGIFSTDSGALRYDLEPERHAWLHVARGAVALNGISFKSGDGVAISEAQMLEISAQPVAEILLFDLA